MKHFKKQLLSIFLVIAVLLGIARTEGGVSPLGDNNPRPETGEVDIDE